MSLVVTERGLKRLGLRAYRVFSDFRGPSRQTVWNDRERVPLVKGSPQERRMRLKQVIAFGWRSYFLGVGLRRG